MKAIKQSTIEATVMLENSMWVAIFERKEAAEYAVAREIFGSEPPDAELYQFVLHHFDKLRFTAPTEFILVVKRKNYKRMQRDVRYEMEKAKTGLKSESHAQEVLRLDLEQKKKIRKTVSKAEKEAESDKKFQLKQEKRKQKHRGH